MSDYSPSAFPPPPGVGPQAPVIPAAGKKKRKDKGDKPVTKGLITANKVPALVLAVAAGLMGFLLISKKPPTAYVVQAKQPLEALATVDSSQIEAVQVDIKAVERGALAGPSEEAALAKATKLIEGGRLQYPLAKGQQLWSRMFSTEVILAAPLAADERLMSIRATVPAAVAGILRPGDRVDVYGSTDSLAGLVASDLEVVAITLAQETDNKSSAASGDASADDGAAAKTDTGSSPVGGTTDSTYVLRVKGDVIAKLVTADANSKLYLTYRGAEASDIENMPASLLEVLCTGAASPCAPAK